MERVQEMVDTGVRFAESEDMDMIPTNLLTLEVMIPRLPPEVVLLTGTVRKDVRICGHTTCNLNMVVEAIWRHVPSGIHELVHRGKVSDFRAWSPEGYNTLSKAGAFDRTPVLVVHDTALWDVLGVRESNGVCKGGLDSLIAFVYWVMVRGKVCIPLDTYLLGSRHAILARHPVWAQVASRSRIMLQGSGRTGMVTGAAGRGRLKSGLSRRGILEPILDMVTKSWNQEGGAASVEEA